jgi:hypothetical protein
LHNGSAPIQLELVALVQVPSFLPVSISNEVAAVIVDHDALVESVVLEDSILPSFLLSLQVMCEEANEVHHESRRRYRI